MSPEVSTSFICEFDEKNLTLARVDVLNMI
jgi:hypothetical protein